MPFHAGEITLEVLTAMLFADFDFEKALIFLVNYGRDNDTTSAILGGVLGAFCGADHLPARLVEPVLRENKKLLETDLEQMANQLTDKILATYQH
jgi:ADP-ribosylglycohydrolase